MRGHTSVLIGIFLVCWASCSFADERTTIETLAPAASLPTKVLGSIAAIGDSITAAFNAAYSEFESCQYRDTPNYGFSTNTTRNTTISIAERAIAFRGNGIKTANFASDGARMSSGDDQALLAKTWLLNQATPRLITVFFGHNDICSGERDKFQVSCSSLNRDPNNYCRTSAFAYEQEMRQMLDVLITIPDSQIIIIHPIRVSQICNFASEKVIDGPLLSVRCSDLWATSSLFGQDGVCPSLTRCSVDRVSDAYTTWVTYRDISNRVVDEYNLYTGGQTIPFNPSFNTGNVVRESNVFLETTDVIGNQKFRYRDPFGNAQLSVCECYHPSKYGQNLLASSVWEGVACSTANPCCNDNVVGDSDYNKGLCINFTTSGWMGGPWAGLEADKTLTVVRAGSGNGVVGSVPAGIDCGIDCSETYSHGTAITLTATADPGFVFRGWSGGGCSGSGPECVITLISNTTINALFTLPTGLSPAEGTIGTILTVTGSDFGAKKRKVLVGEVAARIAKDGWTDTMIVCTLKRVPPAGGPYDVTIKPYKADDIILPSAFTVKPPEIDFLDSYQGIAGVSVVTITGKFFGTRKGKVYLEYEKKGNIVKKNCKVVFWGMDSISFIVPKATKSFLPGTYPLKIMNRIGIAEAPLNFMVEPSS